MGKFKKKQLNPLQHSLEAIQEYTSDGAKSVVKNSAGIAEQSAIDFLDILGLGGKSESQENNDPKKGAVELFNSVKPRKPEVRAHIEYHEAIQKFGEHANRTGESLAIQKIQEALAEIQQLLKSSRALEIEFAEFAVMQAPTEVGEYDLSFFEWLALTIKQAREKVEDSGAWLAAVQGKNGKKGSKKNFINDNWKKGNTAVTMSNERNTATSVG